ncbi:hypothetical protein QBC34DRAFT_294192 [Podospora aff. communis PSN243]|uniref:Xylanolytic transcriptional activator regulatory domain-containing protein n=1 Tax=Podospora aff. communis PSN243 TaxID=3040156 RepID=A0AAV9GV69_9PEZI|nr:hypothetical protein QBC34DRAFT_294192 [Podospora aff. communis PSN243]
MGVGDCDSRSAAHLAAVLDVTVPSMALGDIEIAPEDFLQCIDLFYTHFHPQLPFLSGKSAVIKDSLACPLLAWAVVVVAARVSPNPMVNSIRARLTWPVRRLAALSIMTPRSLPTIQALLILCLWPMPYAAIIDDPSWIWSGIANQKALQLGLYRPLQRLIEYAKGDLQVAKSMQSIWMACVVVGQMHSTRHGIPSTIPLEHVNPQFPLPQGTQILGAAVELARKDMVISSLLAQRDGTSIPPARTPALRALAVELEDLEAKVQPYQSPMLDRILSTIKLRLYSFVFRRSIEPATPADRARSGLKSNSDQADLTMYVSKAYAVATNLITTSLDDDVQRWTFIDLQSFIMALFTVLDISRRHRNFVNVQHASEMFQRASELLKSCSVIDGDHFYRVCEIINYLSSKPPPGGESDQPLDPDAMATAIRPEAGIGVAYDMVKEAKKRYRRSVRFPEEFPDLSADPAPMDRGDGSTGGGLGVGAGGEGSSVGDGSGSADYEWMRDDFLSQSMFPADLNFPSWSGWQ